MKLGKKSLLAALSLIFLSVGFAGNAEAAVTDTSISGELAGTSATSLVVVPSPDGSTNKEYASTAAGLKQALFDLYQKNDNGEYAIYIGTNITNLSGAVDKNPPASPNAADMTFSALEGRIKTLVLTTTTSDIISNNTGAATGAKTVTFGTNAYMGTNVILRNITYTGTNLYMNGHDLSLNGNSQGNGLSVFGGSDTSNVTGSPTITVNATGTGTWNFYGGNNTGGTLNGSTSLVFNNTTGNVTTIAGGARVGTVTGNVDVKINDFGGSIANYYGGGMGTGTSATANVGGNVTTTIDVQNASTKLSLSADVLYGGVQYGNITGTISNTIKGYGSFNGNNTAAGAASPGFIGGSREGNIGSDRTVAAITNDVDTSNYSAGSTAYSGGNNVRGTITGAIKNTVKAGGYRKGSFNGVYGGGSRNIDRLTAALLGTSGSVNAAANTNFDNLGKDARRAKAESAATFRVYGDITLDILAGVVSVDTDPSYTRAAGYGGYIEGDTTVTLGTLNEDGSTGGAGMVYSQYTHTNNLNNTDYDKTKNRRSYNTGYDVVGGGGSPGDSWSIYIYGRTKTVMNNVVARWTYGGNFSGVVEHPDGIDADTYASEYVMNAGIVDTTEGTGYIGQRTYGPSHTQINNGQVDWFTSGGGWWDWKQFGDASVEFVKGIHNGTVGGTYGYSGVDNHVIDGDVSVTILGGDFSGTPSHTGNKNFSAGPSQQGTVTGDATLTIDLTTENGKTFVPPSQVQIAAGRYYNAGTSVALGSGDNTVTLNVFANEESGDVLNGATIYGDGGTRNNESKIGNIVMNIDAPGSTIGTLYATQYSNIASNTLLRNVDVNLQRMKSIGGISGGNAGDNINNTVAANSAAINRFSTFKVGVSADPTETEPQYQTDPIMVSGIGLINFTSLLVDNGTTLTASSGNIKNGGSATKDNHASTYSTFGDIRLRNNAGLGVTGTNAFISGGKLTVEDENQIESGQGTGIINISDIDFTDPDNSRLTWVKNNTATTPTVSANGTWFGVQTAYQVLTINPTVGNASKITPFNFKGYEKATGKTFIGDNDVTGSANGYGIMMPGSVIDYVVKDPVVDGKGDIEHNVTDVKPGNQPTPLKVWGTEVAGTKVQKGRLIIPSSSNISPKMTFTPETATTGSWLYNATISSSKIGSTPEVIDEQPNSNPADWTSPDGTYSYGIEVRYSNKVELDARSIILTETEAASTSKASIEAFTEVDGRPFLTSNIDSVLAEIQAPLGEDEYSRQTVVNYTAGTAALNPANSETKSVNVIVVKDGSIISADRHGAIFAEDAILRLQEVHDLNGDQIEFEKQYTNVRSFKSDGTTTADGTTSPDVTATPSTYYDRLDALTDADVQDDSQVTYKLQYGAEVSESVAITVNVTVMPNTTTFIVKFVDEDGSELYTPITSTETIGSTVDLTTNDDVLAAIAAVEAQHYVLEERPGPDERAIPVVSGGTIVEYKFKGILTLSAPTTIDFGVQAVKSSVKRINQPTSVTGDLTVQDTRKTRSQWKLMAKLTSDLSNGTNTVTDALIYVYNGNDVVLGSGSQEVAKNTNIDNGIYKINDSWSESGDGLKLETKIGAVKSIGDYVGTITWELVEAPL